MSKIWDSPHRVRFWREHSDELLSLFVVGYGGQLTFDPSAGGCGPPVSLVVLHRFTFRVWCAMRLLTDSMMLVVLTDDVGGFD